MPAPLSKEVNVSDMPLSSDAEKQEVVDPTNPPANERRDDHTDHVVKVVDAVDNDGKQKLLVQVERTIASTKENGGHTKKVIKISDENDTDQSSVNTPPTEYGDIFRDLDDAYGTVNQEHVCYEEARIIFARKAALASVLVNLTFLVCGALFFASQTDWALVDVALFTVYTVTSAGYGHVDIPNSRLFQLFDTFYILTGLSLMAIMMAQLYKFLEMEAVRLHKTASLKAEVLQDGIKNLMKLPPSDARNKALQELEAKREKQTGWLDTLVLALTRVIQFSERNPWGDFLYRMGVLVGFAMLGGLTVGLIEQWPWYTCVYWSVVSLTTVGYGDVVPETVAGKAFTTAWLPLNLFFLSILFSSVGHYYLSFSETQIQKIANQLQEDKQKQPAPDNAKILDIENGNMHSISENEKMVQVPTRSSSLPSLPMNHHFIGANLPSMTQVLAMVNSSNGHVEVAEAQVGRLEEDDSKFAIAEIPDLYLRVKVKERLAFIVANDVAGRQSSLTTGDRPGTLNIFLGGTVQAAEKWSIPRNARPAFRAVAFEALLYIGEKRLMDEGVSALHSLSPLQFHRIFSPFVVAMGDKETLQSWLTSTTVLWDNECKAFKPRRSKQISVNSIHFGHRNFAKSGDKPVDFPTNHAEGFRLFHNS